MEALDAAAWLAPAELPAGLEVQGLASRPQLTAGAEPRAVVVLLEITAGTNDA